MKTTGAAGCTTAPVYSAIYDGPDATFDAAARSPIGSLGDWRLKLSFESPSSTTARETSMKDAANGANITNI